MLQVYVISENDRDYWDQEISRFEYSHPLNAFAWGSVRSVDGWSPHYFVVKRENIVTAGIMILSKKIPLTGLSIMYAPRGPVWDIGDRESLRAILTRIRTIARKKHAVLLRVDPNIEEGEFRGFDPLEEEGFRHLENRWTFWNTPRDVLRIDLTKSPDEESLFRTFDPDARRCIRKAQREGIVVRPAANLDDLQRFFKVFKEFSVEKGFMSRGYDYQKALWTHYIVQGMGMLFIAMKEGQIIGGSICLAFGKKCLGMHMGSAFKYNRFKTNDLLEWESIRWAKAQNFRWFSFRGLGPTPSMDRFKRKFGPELVQLVGYYDLPLQPLLYRIYHLCEFTLLPRAWPFIIWVRKSLFRTTDVNKRNEPAS